MLIRKILESDIEIILELNHKSVKVLSPLDKNKLLRLLAMSALSVVVEEDNQVAAFLLAFTNGAKYESINYIWFNQHYDLFLYIDRIVVSEQFRGKGIASNLYQYLINWADKHMLQNLVAEIDVLPPNEASLLFHQKFGFKKIKLLKHNENKMVSLQAKMIG